MLIAPPCEDWFEMVTDPHSFHYITGSVPMYFCSEKYFEPSPFNSKILIK
jgi:hypothetical protein